MPSSTQLEKAKLIPLNGDELAPESEHITVQFNPASLRVSLSNSLKTENNGGDAAPAAQYVDKSESSLSIELLFDSSVTAGQSSTASDGQATFLHQDVRALTQKVAKTFMEPQNQDSDRPGPPRRCRFQWGSFAFTGMLSSYGETLDFFSPAGVPLRATLALTFKEDRFQFEVIDLREGARNSPTSQPGGADVPTSTATQQAGRDPRQWRDTAMYNGTENPRESSGDGVAIPPSGGVSADGQPSANGVDDLGASIPGAFS